MVVREQVNYEDSLRDSALGQTSMAGISIYEFDALAATAGQIGGSAAHVVPTRVFDWLEDQCLGASNVGQIPWLRLAQRGGRRIVQVTSFVGVLRSPDGYQIEILPKIGRAIGGGTVAARQQLLEMLRCLRSFRHIQTDRAKLAATRMPLLDIFVEEFLHEVRLVVKHGLRSEYHVQESNLQALRGKLQIGTHLRENLYRADRFFTAHDEYSLDRPENRLLHAALRRVLALAASRRSEKLSRELEFVFADVPVSTQVNEDFQRVRLDRGMGYYSNALAWARLILDDRAPLTGAGGHSAPSLLFPMEAVFEAYVAKHLAGQLTSGLVLKTQARSQHLVSHRGQDWFRLKPDLLIRDADRNLLVLDTKWKLLDASFSNAKDKYGLAQSDFYQLLAYGQNYLDGVGDVVLVYPKSEAFEQPLGVFEFAKCAGLRLWVVPFCLKSRRLLLPDDEHIAEIFGKPARDTARGVDFSKGTHIGANLPQ